MVDAILTDVLARVAQLHSEGDVHADITTQVNGAVSAAVTAAVAPFQQQITDLENALSAVVTKLGDPATTADAANVAVAAIATSQAATAENVAAVGTGTATTADAPTA